MLVPFERTSPTNTLAGTVFDNMSNKARITSRWQTTFGSETVADILARCILPKGGTGSTGYLTKGRSTRLWRGLATTSMPTY